MFQTSSQSRHNLVSPQQGAHIEHSRTLHATGDEQTVDRHQLADLHVLLLKHGIEDTLQISRGERCQAQQLLDIELQRWSRLRFLALLQLFLGSRVSR